MFQSQTKPLPIRRRIWPTPLVLALVFHVAACDSKSEVAPESASSPAKAKAGGDAHAPEQPVPEAKPAATPKVEAKPAVELAEYDLSPGGPEWEGWVASAPAGCKVMGDLTKKVRIACGKPTRLDVTFDQNEVDFAKAAKSMTEAAKSVPEFSVTITTEEPDALAWERENHEYKFTTHSFLDRMTVDGVVITCGNNPTRGLEDVGELELYRTACASVTKKK